MDDRFVISLQKMEKILCNISFPLLGDDEECVLSRSSQIIGQSTRNGVGWAIKLEESTYLALRFQTDAQRRVDLQTELSLHLTLAVGRLASVESRIVSANLMQSQPVSTARYPPAIGDQSDSSPVDFTDFQPPGIS